MTTKAKPSTSSQFGKAGNVLKRRIKGEPTLFSLKKPIYENNKAIDTVSFKHIFKLFQRAEKQKRVIVFNFGEKELEYANPSWLVIHVKRFKP